MNEAFLREYFEKNQEMFYIRFWNDPEKWKLEKKRSEATETFKEKYVCGNDMEADFEAMLNAIWDDDYEAHVLMFLYGADEREQMLR